MRIAIVLTTLCLTSLAFPLGRTNNFSSFVKKNILPQKNQATTNEEQLISDKQLDQLTCQPNPTMQGNEAQLYGSVCEIVRDSVRLLRATKTINWLPHEQINLVDRQLCSFWTKHGEQFSKMGATGSLQSYLLSCLGLVKTTSKFDIAKSLFNSGEIGLQEYTEIADMISGGMLTNLGKQIEVESGKVLNVATLLKVAKAVSRELKFLVKSRKIVGEFKGTIKKVNEGPANDGFLARAAKGTFGFARSKFGF